MAEAVVEDPHRFFCHKCSLEIGSVLPDYTCPRCCSGFIEALDGSAPSADQGEESEEDIDVTQPWELLNDVFLMGMNGDPLVDTRRTTRGRRGREGERRPGRNNRSRHTFENLMHLFVMNVNGDLGAHAHSNLAAGRAGGFGPEMFVGNPGDYAWGREGFDAIVTQLLNQIESTGPPPLTKEKISEIPVVTITQEQVDKSLQCSVCWENFKVDEPVRQLVCTHVYHEGCIIPWLELHGTCPVCRKPLSSEAEQSTTDDGSRRDPLQNLAARAAASQSRVNQMRQINRQMEELRNRYGLDLGTIDLGTISTPLANRVRSSAMQTDPSAASTSSSSETTSADTSSPSTGSSSSSNNSNGGLQDMDVD
ncbi:E3 ubiquitin-protein ligase RNF126 [Frankliniella fusca]|uniref:RING-type E3 ubiquitin transferase n=1 Tax=Frankliniella fusca TaxID=407009 RepID=A0AAE1LT03_9NEOP|nr:E3 ubiquitin-protein ligase RNF126 [Frankliniella fusca]